MDNRKLPYAFCLDPELQDIRSLSVSSQEKNQMFYRTNMEVAKLHLIVMIIFMRRLRREKDDSGITEHDFPSVGKSNNVANRELFHMIRAMVCFNNLPVLYNSRLNM